MIRRKFLCAGIALMISFILPLHPQSGTPWKDPSPHAVRFVSVGDGVRLEVLDWCGSGRAVVLLAGGGDTAHVFDDFAPKLTTHNHVYGVLIALCFGLRISEILGLRWTDFDFKRSVVLIQRSAVGKRLNKLKTEYSQDEVPIERGFILELKKWQALCHDSEGRWLFPSPVTGRPYHADSIRADHLVPTGLQLGLGRIGFHTFRHTYRAWLDETGAPVGVQQKLMRHAHVSTTMDQYGNASALAKRKANRPIVQRLLRRSANQQVSVQ